MQFIAQKRIKKESLGRDPAFWGMTATQFLGAFNDNLFKQLILLISIQTIGSAASSTASDEQGFALKVFAVPFVLFTGIAGYLSDRYGKRRLIVGCKVFEVVVMALGVLAFAWHTEGGTDRIGLYGVLFLMGLQSALFGPAKYGVLPELFAQHDLPKANGIILMTTFLAIIFGTACAGLLSKNFQAQLWIAAGVCVVIASLGTGVSLLVRKLPPAQADLPLTWSSWTVPPDMRRLLASDRPLLLALLVSSIFWLVAGMVPAGVNSLAKLQLGQDDLRTSLLTATIGVGIAIGCLAGGIVSRGRIDFRLLNRGGWGILVCLTVLGISRPGGAHLLGYYGSLPVLIVLGISTGLFAVPLQVFLQSRPPEGKRGRMIAVMNQANWIGVLVGAELYERAVGELEAQNWPPSTVFYLMAVLMLPVAWCYRPRNEQLD